jgi:hypothetical protein
MIARVWRELGGPDPDRRGRAAAWWRDSTDRNIHLGGEQWYDFARSVGGGAVELVSHVLGYSYRDSKHWLISRGIIPENRTPRRIITARPTMRLRDVEDFRRGLTLSAEAALQQLKELASLLDPTDPELSEIAAKILGLTSLTEAVKRSPHAVYSAARAKQPRALRVWVRLGRAEREHIDLVAAACIRLLELAVSA